MRRDEILRWINETDQAALADLHRQADAVRREHVGDAVHLRGLIEFSNHCEQRCGYCGIRAPNQAIPRYRMSSGEVLDRAREVHRLGYGTVVLQSGEDPVAGGHWIADLIRSIKAETDLAITLSLGERSEGDLATWREAGADRYLLRFESSNPELFRKSRETTPHGLVDRIRTLEVLKSLGYEVGSGMLIGLPGQTSADLARDIALLRELDLDMIGVGPFIPHPGTPIGRHFPDPASVDGQVPSSEEMALKVIAMARICCPDTNIPATTAVATLNQQDGYERGLRAGANVVMPCLTPDGVRAQYQIYPNKARLHGADPETQRDLLVARIHAMGRTVGRGRGDSPKAGKRSAMAVVAPE